MSPSSVSLDSLQHRIAYHFTRPALLERALTHKSVGADNNERLEFLGDSLLNAIIAEALFLRDADIAEGTMTTARATLVKGRTLADIGFDLGLDQLLQLGKGERKSSSRVKRSIVGDAVEAVIAAVYLDSNFDTCRQMVLSVYRERLAQVSIMPDSKDPKTALQERMQSLKLALPQYRLHGVDGPDHDKKFTVECRVEEKGGVVAIGEGRSRRAAEQSAAQTILDSLEE